MILIVGVCVVCVYLSGSDEVPSAVCGNGGVGSRMQAMCPFTSYEYHY